MKGKYKYIILVIITIVASVMIYEYIMSFSPVPSEGDILYDQVQTENSLLGSTNYTIDNPNVILDPYGLSPLTALVIFQTKDLATVTVTVKGRDGAKDIENTFIPSRVHTIPIYGLYPDYENTVIISSSGETKELKIKTAALPDNLKKATSLKSETADEFYFTTTADTGYPVAYDSNGDIRWYFNKNYHWDYTRLSNGHVLLSTYKSLNQPDYAMGLQEMDLLGKVYAEYLLPGGYHHDVYEIANGNLLVASNNFNGGTVEDYIVELDRATGNIVKTIDLYDLMPNDEGYNWFGLNSIIYEARTNSIMVTGSNKDVILNIDYGSGELNWIIGNTDSVSQQYQKYLLKADGEVTYPIKPEALTTTSDGHIAYINADSNNALIEYEVNAVNKSFKEIKNIDLGPAAENVNLDYQANVLTIVKDNKIIEINDEKAIDILEAGHNLYSAKKYKIYAGDVYVAGQGLRLGSTGVSETTKNHFVIFSKTDDSIIDKYKISLYKDANRLQLNGTFKKSDKVQIILDNVLDKKTYDVQISETPYLKDDNNKKSDKIAIETYINEEGLNGKYYIYLRINGTIYKLHKYVFFY